jgi:hypothetical protein
MRWLTLTGVLVIALVGAGRASAEPPVLTQPYNQAQYEQAVRDLIRRAITPATTPDPAIPPDLDANKVRSGMWRARSSARVLPAARALGKLSLTGSALTLGWAIGTGATKVWLRFGLPTLGSTLSPATQLSCQSGEICRFEPGVAGDFFAWNPPATDDGIWTLSLQTNACTFSSTDSPMSDYYLTNGYGGTCGELVWGDGVRQLLIDQWNYAGTPNGGNLPGQAVTRTPVFFPNEHHRTATREQFEQGLGEIHDMAIGAAQPAWYGQPGQQTFDSSVFTPAPDAGTTAPDLAAIRARLDGAPSADVRTYVNTHLDPTYDPDPPPPPTTLPMPKPNVNETYTAYLTRLQALGYVGTATTTVLSSELQGYGPNAPARITIPGTTVGTVRTLDPLAWPSTLPTLSTTADIELRYNPSTSAPIPTEGGSGGTVVRPEPYDPPGLIDFSPLTPDETCTKFPFGVVCWVADQLELMFLQPADPPAMSATIPAFDSGFATIPAITFAWDFGDPRYEGTFDTYISVVRTALAFMLWLGGLWFLGTRLLGVRGAQETDGID